MTVVLEIELLSHWRAGTGRDRPGMLDATCQRDADNLPMIPGKHLKGLLRDVMIRAKEFGWTTSHGQKLLSVEALFGDEGNESIGTIRVESACMSKADKAAIKADPNLIDMLFETRRTTAIGPEGTAKSGSLRFEEVAVPMTLQARLRPLANAPEDWQDHIEAALPLLRGIGAQRTRGLGRCIVTIKNQGQR